MRTITLALCALFALSTPVLAQGLDAEQQAWLDKLAKNPQRVSELMQAEQLQVDRERWAQVKTVGLSELVLASEVRDLEPTPVDLSLIRHGQPLFIWLAIETPETFEGVADIKVYWYYEQNESPERLNTLTVTQASPRWRTWDQWRLRKSGSWTVVIMHAERELGRTSFTVH